MDNEETPAVRALAARVFSGQERWGWEYAEPAAPRQHPRVGIAPAWLAPDWTPLARQAESRSAVAGPIKWFLLCSPIPFLCVPYGIVVSGLMWVVALCLTFAYLVHRSAAVWRVFTGSPSNSTGKRWRSGSGTSQHMTWRSVGGWRCPPGGFRYA
jgi:hypothetical protein